MTLIQLIRDMISQGRAHDLNAIVTSPELNIYKNVQLAKVVAANASILEALTGNQ